MSRKDEQVPKPEDWLRAQPHIRQLYVVDQRPLKEVSKILEEQHGFHASQRMYKSRIQAWKYDKKFKEAEWRQIIAIWKRRREQEGKESIFKVRGRTINSAKIRKFLKRKKVEESDFLSSVGESEPLSEIHCFTPAGSPTPGASRDSQSPSPEPDQDPSPITEDSRHNSLSWPGQPESAARDPRPIVGYVTQRTLSVPGTHSHPLLSLPHLQTTHTHPQFSGPGMSSILRTGSDSSGSSSRLVHGIDGMALRSLTPDSVMLDERDELILSNLLMAASPATLAGEAGEADFRAQQLMPSPLTTVPVKITDGDVVVCGDATPEIRSFYNLYASSQDTLASQWLSRLFQACIFHRQNRQDLFDRNRQAAAEVFYNMIKSQNSYLLPGLLILSGILTAQDLYPLVASFLKECCDIAKAHAGPEHPFTIAFEHMREICARYAAEDEAQAEESKLQLPPRQTTQEHLQRAITTFELAWASDHPNTIVLKYHRAWDILNEGNPAAAEPQLRTLLPLCERVMGPCNYVTTAIMRTLSRACGDQKNLKDAITFMREAVERQQKSLGQFHPDRVEGIRRLGEMYEELGDLRMAEMLYAEALQGQRKMLGITGLTMYTLEQLSNVMKNLGKHTEEQQLQEEIDREQQMQQQTEFEPPVGAY